MFILTWYFIVFAPYTADLITTVLHSYKLLVPTLNPFTHSVNNLSIIIVYW